MKAPAFLFVAGLAALVSSPSLTAADAAAPAAPAAPAAVARTFDFGDSSSSTLTTKAWAAYIAKDAVAVMAFTNKCRDLYLAEALRQQSALTAPVPTSDPERVHANWALNDVGTCMFIQGQSLEQSGKTADAIVAYKLLVEKMAFAQCWDEKGWFWSPADAARTRLRALEFEKAQF